MVSAATLALTLSI